MFLPTSQGLPDYTKWLTHYSTKQQDNPAKPITCRSYARWDGTNYFHHTWFKMNVFPCKFKDHPPSNLKTRAIQMSVCDTERISLTLCDDSQGWINGESLRWLQWENHRHVHL